MDIVISPAKKLDFNEENNSLIEGTPVFMNEANSLVKSMKTVSSKELAKMMKLSEKLADLNVARFSEFSKTNDYGPAVLSFAGDTYQGLNAKELNKSQLNYAQKHLRILSGLYGLLRPLDELRAYRLEMGTRINVGELTTLYKFWDDKIVEQLNADLKKNKSKYLVNLASEEYFKSVNTKLLSAQLINVKFLDFKNGVYKIISFNAKRARGMMARYIIENKVKDIEELKNFDYAGYKFSEINDNELTFKRKQ